MTARNRSALALATAVVAILLAVSTGAFLRLSNAETCLATGTHLTDGQLVDIAVQEVLLAYPPEVVRTVRVEGSNGPVYQELEQTESANVYTLAKPKRSIGYANATEFHTLNPGCCEVENALSLEAGPPSQLSKAIGGEVAFVRLTYRVRYATSTDVKREVKYQEYVGITACGSVVRYMGTTM